MANGYWIKAFFTVFSPNGTLCTQAQDRIERMKITPEEDQKLTEILKRYKPFGVTILQWMAIFIAIGVGTSLVYEYLHRV